VTSHPGPGVIKRSGTIKGETIIAEGLAQISQVRRGKTDEFTKKQEHTEERCHWVRDRKARGFRGAPRWKFPRKIIQSGAITRLGHRSTKSHQTRWNSVNQNRKTMRLMALRGYRKGGKRKGNSEVKHHDEKRRGRGCGRPIQRV